MATFVPVSQPITPQWLTAVLRASGALVRGDVVAVAAENTGAFNSYTQRLKLTYSADAAPTLAATIIAKLNIPEPWAIEAGAEEVKFYQASAGLQPAPPGLVPCYAAAFDAASGNSYLLLEDLSETHAPPITRDQQVSIVEAVPAASAVDQVIDALAQHHAYWWNHPLLASGLFEVGYWSRNAARFARYFERRQISWASLRAAEASWFPTELCELYDTVFLGLHQYWAGALEPRFRTRTNLTLVHGDAYFANFLCPRQLSGGATYLLDWQSPTVDLGGYDLANLCATFWTPEQRHDAGRERLSLERYLAVLHTHGVTSYSWNDLIADYQAGLIYWLLVPLQDRYGGAKQAYWWPKMQCLVAAFREWRCGELLGWAA